MPDSVNLIFNDRLNAILRRVSRRFMNATFNIWRRPDDATVGAKQGAYQRIATGVPGSLTSMVSPPLQSNPYASSYAQYDESKIRQPRSIELAMEYLDEDDVLQTTDVKRGDILDGPYGVAGVETAQYKVNDLSSDETIPITIAINAEKMENQVKLTPPTP